MLCVSLLLMIMKSIFNFKFAFSEIYKIKNNNKDFQRKILIHYTLPLYLIILSICVCFPSRSLQINARIRNEHKKNLSVVYAKDTVLRGVCLTILAKNQLFLNEAKMVREKRMKLQGK